MLLSEVQDCNQIRFDRYVRESLVIPVILVNVTGGIHNDTDVTVAHASKARVWVN